ncbi:MAG: hypothetical protein EOM25_13110 [Deltaproteobacteria bacterium]|nr:hypothetical protein [Deltaproteobacteria bacterium]
MSAPHMSRERVVAIKTKLEGTGRAMPNAQAIALCEWALAEERRKSAHQRAAAMYRERMQEWGRVIANLLRCDPDAKAENLEENNG